MVCSSIGGALFKPLTDRFEVESFMQVVFVVAAATLAVPGFLTSDSTIIFAAFLVFEVCVGVFWPGVGTMRSKYVPEASRAAVMNLFRVPLNCIVCFVLLNNLALSTVFQACTVMLLGSAVCQMWLSRRTSGGPAQPMPLRQREMDEQGLEMVESGVA